MARDYGKIRHRYWSGETGKAMRALPMDVRTVGAYLMSCGSSNMIGLYYLPLTLMVHEIGSGLTIEGASKALRSLGELDFAHYDEASEVVFVPHMAREQIAEELSPNDKQRAGVIAQLKEYEKCRYYGDFLALYRDAFHLEELADKQAPSKGLPRPIEAPSKPESRDQGTESREQVQEPLRSTCGKIRPRNANDLEHCLRVAIERAQPQAGRWIAGRFSDRDAGKLLRELGDIETALPELERKIALFAQDPDMQPWSMAKFCDKYVAIGLPKLEFGRAPKKPEVHEETPIREW